MNTLRTYLRHVVYKNDHYRCGICDRSYKKEAEAKACLGSCWHDVLAQSLVSIAQSFPKSKFRCKLCFRNYDDYESAVKCSVECKTAFKPVLIDQGAFDIPVKPKFYFGKKPPKPVFKDDDVKMIDEEAEAKEQAHEEHLNAGLDAKKEEKKAPAPAPAPVKEAAPEAVDPAAPTISALEDGKNPKN